MTALYQFAVVLLPGVVGLGLFALRGRWWRRGVVVAMIAAQWYLALTFPAKATTELMGLTLEWSPLGTLFLPLFGALALALIVQGEGPPYGQHFASLVLFVLAALGGLLVSEPLLAAFLLVAAGLVSLFVIPQRTNLAQSWQAAYRYWVHTFVGGVALILGILMSEASGAALGNLPLFRVGMGFLALGFALRLGIIPLHRWTLEVEGSALGMAAALILGLVNVGALILLVIFLLDTPPAALDPRAGQLFAWGGLFSIGLGGLLSLGQDDPSRLVVFSSVFDVGFVLYGLASVTELGWLGALWGIFHHGIIQLVLHSSLGLAERHRKDGGKASLAGVLGFWGGGFALAGLPPLSPSLGRWLILTVALRRHWGLAALMLGATAAVLLAYLRVGHRLLLAPAPVGAVHEPPLLPTEVGEGEVESPRRQNRAEPAMTRLVIGLALVVMVVLTFYPSPILTLMRQAIRDFAFPTT